LFPKRSRRDLKLKYKKEERHNPGLINKALLHPKRFNIEELEEELKQEEAAKREIAAKEELQAQQEKANRAPKRSAQIENVKTKMPQKKVSNAMRIMTDGNEVYGSNRPTRARKRKPAAPIATTTVDQEICLPIIVNPPVRYQQEYPVPSNDTYCPNYSTEESKASN
jgi:transcription factor TFIIIB component B''